MKVICLWHVWHWHNYYNGNWRSWTNPQNVQTATATALSKYILDDLGSGSGSSLIQTGSDDGDVIMSNPIPCDTIRPRMTGTWMTEQRPDHEWCGHLPCLMQSRLFIGVFMAHFVNTNGILDRFTHISRFTKFENISGWRQDQLWELADSRHDLWWMAVTNY